MFSTTPRSRIDVFCAIVAARAATSWASGCGVVTTTTSARGRSCPSEIDTSPVPGGMSTRMRVEPRPVHVREELLERAVEHRPAPHHRLVVVEEEADRHQVQAVRDQRDHHPVDEHRLLVRPEHVRDRVAVDVGVDHAHLLALLGERGGEVDGERRLADAALARRDRDHARRGVDRDPLRPLGRRAAQPAGERRRSSGVITSNASEVERDAGERADEARDLLLERVAERAAGDRQRDRDVHVAALDPDVADHVELRHGPAQLGVDDLLERLEDVVAGDHGASVARQWRGRGHTAGRRTAPVGGVRGTTALAPDRGPW